MYRSERESFELGFKIAQNGVGLTGTGREAAAGGGLKIRVSISAPSILYPDSVARLEFTSDTL